MSDRTRELPASDRRHGTNAGYVAGCRCERCRDANRQYRAAQKARGLPDPGDPRHGTVGGFTNYHCRCERCRDAMRVWDATRRRPTRKQEMRANHRRWYATNCEKRRAQIDQYRAENRDALVVAAARYREENREAIRAYFRSPEGRAAKNRAEARRRASKRGSSIGDLAELREYRDLIARDPCSYCGRPTEHIDHIVPLARGGAESWDNLTPACASCNGRKHTRSLLDFLLAGSVAGSEVDHMGKLEKVPGVQNLAG